MTSFNTFKCVSLLLGETNYCEKKQMCEVYYLLIRRVDLHKRDENRINFEFVTS